MSAVALLVVVLVQQALARHFAQMMVHVEGGRRPQFARRFLVDLGDQLQLGEPTGRIVAQHGQQLGLALIAMRDVVADLGHRIVDDVAVRREDAAGLAVEDQLQAAHVLEEVLENGRSFAFCFLGYKCNLYCIKLYHSKG